MACGVNNIPAGLQSPGIPTLELKPEGTWKSLLEVLGDTPVTTVGLRNTAVTRELGPRSARAELLNCLNFIGAHDKSYLRCRKALEP